MLVERESTDIQYSTIVTVVAKSHGHHREASISCAVKSYTRTSRCIFGAYYRSGTANSGHHWCPANSGEDWPMALI
jgi:hypothetical protein